MNAGRTVVDTSTVPSALARRGVDFCDTLVARMRLAAIDGTLINMMGGDAALVERLYKLLAHVVCDVTHCGHVGSGQAVKILNNMNLFQNVRALAEGLAIAGRQGVAPETSLEVLGRSSGDGFRLRNRGMKAISSTRRVRSPGPTRSRTSTVRSSQRRWPTLTPPAQIWRRGCSTKSSRADSASATIR